MVNMKSVDEKKMVTFARNNMVSRKPKESLRIIVTVLIATGFIIGISFPILSSYRIWVPSNPRGAERLPPDIVAAESDLYLRRLYGKPSEDLKIKPNYLVTFTVGYNQKQNIDAAVKKFSQNFTILLFHYDGRTTEWNEFEWSKRAIHVSVLKQTKWWYAKRFLHPDIVAPYDYIFMWDEDLGVEHFNAEEYIKLVRKHGLEISQPGLDPRSRGTTWQMTKRQGGGEVHKKTTEKPGWCGDPHLPPCAAFVENMAPVFSREAWRCVWHLIQNDLVHGWGLDFALQKCVEPAHEKIGVVDAQWVVYQGLPSLGSQIWVPSNPRGAERLPPDIVAAESDLYLGRLYGKPSEDLKIKPNYLVTFTVGYNQTQNIDATVKKFSENFTILLFHYDGRTTEWNEFEWSKRAIHVSVLKQTKWWYAKRFLHPDIVAPYDYIFMWDEDLGVEHFNAEEYIKLVRKHGLEISQPGLDPRSRGTTWRMTKRQVGGEVHKKTTEKPGWCGDPRLPPCAAFVEIMAPVFSREAWRCVWHLIQNDLVHGWGLDFALQKCVEPAHEKIGVVDAQWVVHQGIPSLGIQGQAHGAKKRGKANKAPLQGVRDRCEKEWAMFQARVSDAEKAYNKSIGLVPPTVESHIKEEDDSFS